MRFLCFHDHEHQRAKNLRSFFQPCTHQGQGGFSPRRLHSEHWARVRSSLQISQKLQFLILHCICKILWLDSRPDPSNLAPLSCAKVNKDPHQSMWLIIQFQGCELEPLNEGSARFFRLLSDAFTVSTLIITSGLLLWRILLNNSMRMSTWLPARKTFLKDITAQWLARSDAHVY